MTSKNVKGKWLDGNLRLVDSSNYKILEIDGPNRRIEPYILSLVDSEEIQLGTATGGDVVKTWNGSYMEYAPGSGFWATCPYLAYPDASLAFSWFEDFIGSITLPTATGAGGGWDAHADSDHDVTATAGTLGGTVKIAPETGSDKELYYQLGEKGTETYLEYTKNSGLKSWVEFRVAYTSVTNAQNIFVGLAEEGCADSDFIADAGADFADKDVVGFSIWEADPNAIDCNHKKSGGALADAGLSGVPVAGTYLTLGLYFDGVETVSFYHNGTAVQTADLDTATFPTGEEMSPIIALKNGATDAAIEIDWIKIVAER